jgi:hypothetical protein
MKGLEKKVGPLKLWQWGIIVGGTGLAYYLYERKKATSSEVNPEEEEKLLGALSKAGGGGSNGASTGESTLKPPEGPAGIAGPAGPAGPAGENPSAALSALPAQFEALSAKTSALETDIEKNQPQTKAHTAAAQATPKGWVRNTAGELYRVVDKGNAIYHEYKDRTGPSKILKVAEKHTAKPPAKRPKPTPLAHKVVSKPAKAKAPARAKAKPPPKKPAKAKAKKK